MVFISNWQWECNWFPAVKSEIEKYHFSPCIKSEDLQWRCSHPIFPFERGRVYVTSNYPSFQTSHPIALISSEFTETNKVYYVLNWLFGIKYLKRQTSKLTLPRMLYAECPDFVLSLHLPVIFCIFLKRPKTSSWVISFKLKI